jgi:integrase
MARSVKSRKLDTRTARRSIPRSKITHWHTISRGRALGYRRGLRGGIWVARFDAEHLRREQRLGVADDVFDADSVQILSFAQALDKASQFFAGVLSIATGETPRGGPYTIRTAVSDYLRSLENRGAPDHRGAVYDFNRNVLPELGAVEVAKITRAKLEAWRARLAARPRLSTKKYIESDPPSAHKVMTDEEKRQRRATTNRSLRRVVAALNFALETGKVNANPMNWKIAAFQNAEVARATFLTEAQQRAFVRACGNEPDFQALVLAALYSGCRLGELARLKTRDVIVTSKTIYIQQSKSGKPRHVFLDEEGMQFFTRLAANRPTEEMLLSRGKNSPWQKDAVKKPMRRACETAGIPRLGFHQLRHSFATRLLTNGVGIKIVAQQLGHSSVRMLEKHYGHLADDHVQQVISTLPVVRLNEAAKEGRGTLVAMPSRRRS